MARIEPIPVESAQGTARELLGALVQRGGQRGPMVRAMAGAPALLRGYLDLTRAMKRVHIDRRIVERINLAVHEWLRCDYCLVAHTRAARRLGVPDNEIQLARQGTSSDPAIAAIVAFAQQVLAGPAEIGDADVDRLRAHARDRTRRPLSARSAARRPARAPMAEPAHASRPAYARWNVMGDSSQL